MKQEDHSPRRRKEEQTVVPLLTHFQHMRQSVPVNHQLKAELKKQLLQRMQELELQNGEGTVIAQSGKHRWNIRLIAAMVIVAVSVAVYSWWEKGVLAVEAQGLLSLPKQTTAEQIDIDPTGGQLAYIAPHDVIRSLPLDEKNRPFAIALPPTKGRYSALSWSNRSGQVAVVEQVGTRSRIWIVRLPVGGSEGSRRLLKEEDEVSYHSPTWSPDDETIAFTRVKNGVEEVWMSSTVSFREWKMAEGSQPEWSPDGRYLAYTRSGNVQVLELGTGKVTALGHGEWPSWRSSVQLTYTSPEGKLEEAQLDKDPVSQRELELLSLYGDEVVRGNWLSDGKQVLLVHRDGPPNSLVVSLATR
ncbi:TolB family protein [Brevibacillus sp. GCM10020057]|uniref:TolB family protein n=1 Tax=Brevibacillus sp. GCM10020057 TaxID=3317327 RepID=UPI00362852EC